MREREDTDFCPQLVAMPARGGAPGIAGRAAEIELLCACRSLATACLRAAVAAGAVGRSRRGLAALR